ncbi:MAG: type II toxin-antitoxin system VapC family toxin [Spirochaetaceae bacterium]|nr:type II toxin-antitoxin system VapC family toxin [Spirochaetaceae bacterium]
MDKTKIVLDTNAAIFLLKSETMRETFSNAEFFMSIITRVELLSKPDITPEEEQDIRDFLASATTVDINDSIESTTIALRRATRIKLPDCFIAATAIALNATLFTHDENLLRLSWPSYTVQDIF